MQVQIGTTARFQLIINENILKEPFKIEECSSFFSLFVNSTIYLNNKAGVKAK